MQQGQAKKGLRYYAPGVYHEHIHVKSNQTVYLDKGAIVYGSLNFWDATNAHVSGLGVVIHDGGQNPNTDEGWQHRPDWHGITAHDAHNISVKGNNGGRPQPHLDEPVAGLQRRIVRKYQGYWRDGQTMPIRMA